MFPGYIQLQPKCPKCGCVNTIVLHGMLRCALCGYMGSVQREATLKPQASGMGMAGSPCGRCHGTGEVLGPWDEERKRYIGAACPECNGLGSK